MARLLDGLEAWDDGDYGKNVEITGLLVREAIAPQAEVKAVGTATAPSTRR